MNIPVEKKMISHIIGHWPFLKSQVLAGINSSCMTKFEQKII